MADLLKVLNEDVQSLLQGGFSYADLLPEEGKELMLFAQAVA